MLSRLPIMRQFTLLGVLGVVLTLLALGLSLKTSYELALQAKENQLKTLVDASVTTAQGFAGLAAAGKMTTPQAQQAALTAIGSARFDDGNYFFVYDYTGLTLMHPNKSYIGTNRYNNTDPYGTVINGPMIEAAKAGTPIFHKYYAPKANQRRPEPKLTYCAAVPQWGWVIGTGLYIDDLQTVLIHHLIGLALLFLPLFAGFVVVLVLLRRTASQLLHGISTSMSGIAKGALETPIPSLGRQDEIGIMARRVGEFREAALQKRALEAQAAAAQAAAETERNAREAERETHAAEQALVVDQLATGLAKLAAGDLMVRLNTAFSGRYEQLRGDFNAAMQSLQETMQVIIGTASGIRGGAGEIAQASDNLSRRTEQQAATLEETAAALDEITAAVRKSAEGASNARDVVTAAKAEAESSGAVVRDTIAAMAGIEESSKKIDNIIGVIDEIAFQTNLLALNAGIEAARAGDAGRGFAVVATEVRALAQRSANAAKEIQALISTSGAQVESGVRLVAETGRALGRIAAQVEQANDLVAAIAFSAAEQSTGLHEVNTAMNQMDQVTQQNAAMVEQTTAASHGLEHETSQLNQLISRFQIGSAPATQPRPRRAVAAVVD